MHIQRQQLTQYMRGGLNADELFLLYFFLSDNVSHVSHRPRYLTFSKPSLRIEIGPHTYFFKWSGFIFVRLEYRTPIKCPCATHNCHFTFAWHAPALCWRLRVAALKMHCLLSSSCLVSESGRGSNPRPPTPLAFARSPRNAHQVSIEWGGGRHASHCSYAPCRPPTAARWCVRGAVVFVDLYLLADAVIPPPRSLFRTRIA